LLAATGFESRAIKLRAALMVTIAVYALALSGSTWLNVPILEGVPLWAGAALLLGIYTRLIFPHALRLQCFIEAVLVSVVLGVSLACLSYIVMLVSAVPSGNHYLADLIAGTGHRLRARDSNVARSAVQRSRDFDYARQHPSGQHI
jgi:hypothetical protein